MKRLAVLIVVGSLLGVLSIEAQIITGTMIGVVRDESGAILPGVTATVTSPVLPGGPATNVTNEQGAYRFTALPPGTYQLRVELTGFTIYEETDLRVTVAGTTERNVTLKVAAVAETLTVSGRAPIVDPRQTGVARSIPEELVENIPIGRGATSGFLASMPGVVNSNYETGAGVLIMGSPPEGSSLMIDGMSSNQPSSGGGSSWYDFDAIAEVNVVSLGASAEYQQAMGGVVSLITKSGTNQYRGDATYFRAPHRFVSTPITRPCNCPEGQTGFKQYKWHDYSFHFGGPIIKNRLWFHSGASNSGPYNRNPGQPEVPEQFQFLRYEARSATKVTAKITDRMTFNGMWTYEWWEWMDPIAFPTFTNPQETLFWYGGDIRLYGSELNVTLSPSIILTAHYNRHTAPSGRVGFGPTLTRDASSLNYPGHLDTFTGVSSVNGTSQPATSTLGTKDEVNVKLQQYVTSGRVAQNLRYGMQVIGATTFSQNVWPGGVLYLDFKGAPDQARYENPSVYGSQSKALGFWVEDEVTFGRVTIVPGVRFDWMKGISPAEGLFDPTDVRHGGLFGSTTFFPSTGGTIPGLGDLFTWKQVSPRLGINVRLTDDSKTILRATVGRYYRPIILTEFNAVHPGISPQTLRGFDPATGGYTTLISVTNRRTNVAIDPDITAPYSDQYSIGVDRELARNVGVSVTYVRKNAKDGLGWRDIGGIYGTQTVATPDGSMTVYPLLNSPTQRKFLWTNGPGFFNRYNGLVVSLSRRLMNRWQFNLGYTYSKSEGLEIAPPFHSAIPTGTGQDPNDYINAAGSLRPNDRPHVLSLVGSYDVPKIDVQLAANLNFVSGFAWGRQIQVALPQGRKNIYYEAPGSFRTPSQKWGNVRVSKTLRRGSRRLEVGAEVRNLFQNLSTGNIITEVAASPNFGQVNQWPTPRQLMFRVRTLF